MTTTAAYDDVADWYESEFLPNQRRFADDSPFADPSGVDQTIVELLGSGSGRCLQMGCGTGIYADRIRSLGWTPVGVDLSAGMLRHARARLPVAHGDAGRLPLPDRSIDAVTAVMIHTDIPHYESVLAEAARVLKPGGRFLHVGVHPCFVGDFVDRATPPHAVVGPDYLSRSWTPGLGADAGTLGRDGQVRDKVGASHVPLAELLTLFVDAGLTPTGFAEGGAPLPITLSVQARASG